MADIKRMHSDDRLFQLQMTLRKQVTYEESNYIFTMFNPNDDKLQS
jgi:hypothetical protein